MCITSCLQVNPLARVTAKELLKKRIFNELSNDENSDDIYEDDFDEITSDSSNFSDYEEDFESASDSEI